ncbi:MAG: MFS transporter [Calditrichaeota bacterium]|nr:MFS transporter [Calditrichota bacterium]MCB9474564.1 MFS transporter [Candidatus Delongbacteria bacterium]
MTHDDGSSRRTMGVLFLTLFLDLVGFSIIFPLFPALLEYYISLEGSSGLLGSVLHQLDRIGAMLGAGGGTTARIVLFGGFLSFLYSLLQFVAAPLAGTLSDRWGRRPVILFSVCGIALSYLLWVFAHSFWLLVLARLLGGLMGSNITTVTAAVADISGEKSRSRGMAIIGIAFGVGMIVGPALGGLTALIRLDLLLPGVPGLNPFSAPALLAFLLALVNLVQIQRRLPETLRPGQRNPDAVRRSLNLFRLFSPLPYPGANANNLAYFVFILAFSGAEFTLTFLAAERLGFGPGQNGLLFVYIGVVLAAVQGGFVRRRASAIGEARMALAGLLILIPGMLLIAAAYSLPWLLVGLFLLSSGSAMVMPCLTTLASLFSPPHEQGRVLGVFRSLGALARTLGPLLACTFYWRHGAGFAWLLGAASLLLPLVIIHRLPLPPRREAEA